MDINSKQIQRQKPKHTLLLQRLCFPYTISSLEIRENCLTTLNYPYWDTNIGHSIMDNITLQIPVFEIDPSIMDQIPSIIDKFTGGNTYTRTHS